jgi:hypothetical protein
MARWTDCYLLRELQLRRHELLASGVYELGFVRRPRGTTENVFTPFYVGKATSLYGRLSSYTYTSCHSDYIRGYYEQGFLNIWYHTFRTDTYAEAEARLQKRLGIGKGGYYRWNQKLAIARQASGFGEN